MHALRARTQVLSALTALAPREDLRVDQRTAARAASHLAKAWHVGVLGPFGRNPPRAGGCTRRTLGASLRLSTRLTVLPRWPTIAVIVLITALLVLAIAHVGGPSLWSQVTAGSGTSLGWTLRNKSSSKVPTLQGSGLTFGENRPASHHGSDDFDVLDRVRVDVVGVAFKHHEIGEFSGRDRSFHVLLM